MRFYFVKIAISVNVYFHLRRAFKRRANYPLKHSCYVEI